MIEESLNYLFIYTFPLFFLLLVQSAWYAVARSKTKTTISLDFSRDRLPPRPHLLWVGSGTLDLYSEVNLTDEG